MNFIEKMNYGKTKKPAFKVLKAGFLYHKLLTETFL
ncbi:hypothetical protein C8J95_105339 [Elizabethkingia sp. YR214]|nr:hypothetical protein C8J95_105339 [Elizabethkingia sp. YR214]